MPIRCDVDAVTLLLEVLRYVLVAVAAAGVGVLALIVLDEWWVLLAYGRRVRRGRAAASTRPEAAAGAEDRPPCDRAASAPRVAFLVAAHNEAACINGLMESIHALDYPAEQVETWIVADRCTDDTAALARRAGATVWERGDVDEAGTSTDELAPGKGPALNELLARHRPQRAQVEVFIILDADVRLAPDYLWAMLDVHRQGYPVVQGRSMSRARQDCALTDVASFANEALHVMQQGRMALGWPNLIIGNTLLLGRSVLETLHWRCAWTSPTEEEVKVPLLRKGIRIGYAAQACVAEESVSTVEALADQRSRWFRDHVVFWLRFGVPMMVRALVRRRWAQAEAVLAHFWMTSHTVELMASSLLVVLAGLSGSAPVLVAAVAVAGLKLAQALALAWATGLRGRAWWHLFRRLPRLAGGWLWGAWRFLRRPHLKGWRHTRHRG